MKPNAHLPGRGTHHAAPGKKRAPSIHLAVVSLIAVVCATLSIFHVRNASLDVYVSQLRLQRESPYDTASAPPAAITYARRYVASSLPMNENGATDGCTADPRSLIVSCCRASGSCYGFADRVRGIGVLSMAARLSSKKLCFDKDYFIPAFEKRACQDGSYVVIKHDRVDVFRNGSDRNSLTSLPGRVADMHGVVRDGLLNLSNDTIRELKNARYISSNLVSDITSVVDLEAEPKRDPMLMSLKFGSLALSISGIIEHEYEAASRVVQAVALAFKRDSMLTSLHARVGASAFQAEDGRHVSHTTNADFDMQRSFPGLLLSILQGIPRTTVCQGALFLASDSAKYIASFKKAVPNGLLVLGCCSNPSHIRVDGRLSDDVQHLIDLSALSTSKRIFSTGGGFSALGSVFHSWNRVQTNTLSWYPSRVEVADFVKDMLESLQCSHSQPVS